MVIATNLASGTLRDLLGADFQPISALLTGRSDPANGVALSVVGVDAKSAFVLRTVHTATADYFLVSRGTQSPELGHPVAIPESLLALQRGIPSCGAGAFGCVD